MTVSSQNLTFKGGQPAEIKVNISAPTAPEKPRAASDSTLHMVVSGTFTPDGGLGNSTGTFSQESFPIQDVHGSKEISFIFTPAPNLKAGDYTLMIGSQDKTLGILRAVKVHAIS